MEGDLHAEEWKPREVGAAGVALLRTSEASVYAAWLVAWMRYGAGAGGGPAQRREFFQEPWVRDRYLVKRVTFRHFVVQRDNRDRRDIAKAQGAVRLACLWPIPLLRKGKRICQLQS